jgi:hypothetical protein
MLPRREEFFQDVRRAARLERQPKAIADSDILSDDRIAKALHGASLWLTPKYVNNYAPEDFAEWTSELQKRLGSAVGAFRIAAGEVPPDQAPTRAQFTSALAAFHELTAAVKEVVMTEWTQAVNTLIEDVEAWVSESGWRSRRVERKMTESLLGTYSLPQLQVFAEADLYVFEPVARFVPAAAGAYDLSIQPSHYITTIYRDFDSSCLISAQETL